MRFGFVVLEDISGEALGEQRMPSIWPSILGSGVSTIPSPLAKDVWVRLYAEFDEFADELAEAGPLEAERYNSAAGAWREASAEGRHYSSYFSPYFRDTSATPGKDRKRILQICEPYYRHLSARGDPLLRHDGFRRLAEGLLTALYSSYSAIRPHLEGLHEVDPAVYAALNPRYEVPPLAIRLLSYLNDGRFGTNPHVDKSALTVILDTDDQDDEPSLLFGDFPVTDRQALSTFRQLPKGSDESFIFLGAALREAGFTAFAPMPHAVGPFTQNVRHSAIFFWLLPEMNMRQFSTRIDFVDDMDKARLGLSGY